jgi:hypothetical protein
VSFVETARMSDLIRNMESSLTEISRALSDDDRRKAALAVADAYPDPGALAYLLVELGLAEHVADGTFVSTRNVDDGAWFVPNGKYVTNGPYRIAIGSLDDVGQGRTT